MHVTVGRAYAVEETGGRRREGGEVKGGGRGRGRQGGREESSRGRRGRRGEGEGAKETDSNQPCPHLFHMYVTCCVGTLSQTLPRYMLLAVVQATQSWAGPGSELGGAWE